MTTSQIRRAGARLLMVLSCASLAACAPAYYGYPYPYPAYAPARTMVELGVVENTRLVSIEGPDTGLGTVGGATIGGLAGSAIGAGSGNVAATIGGVIIGALAGNAIERDSSRRPGVEVTVRTDGGRMVAVVQPDAGEGLRPGDRVRIVSDGYATRVMR